MDTRFLESWFNRNHIVLGQKLKPFSLGHQLILEALDSPFVFENRPFSMADLCLAVRVCSRWSDDMSLNNPTYRERIRFWRGTINSGYFQRESQRFIDYLDDHLAPPKFWDRADTPVIRQSTPWTLEIATTLLRHTGMRESEVWRMPIGKAIWYCSIFAKQTGCDLEILSTDEEEFLDSLRKENPA